MLRSGLLVIVSGPSGTGKGTVLKLLKDQEPNIRFSVSATTRQPRSGEIDGKSYHFKTVDEFKQMIDKDELIEWDEYCGNYYGTPYASVNEALSKGHDVILEITVEGAENIKKKFPESVSIFILPPSFQELKKRIQGRGTEGSDIIDKRLNKARQEIMQVDKYEYLILNDDIDKAAVEMHSILTAEKLKYNRNKDVLVHIGMNSGG